MKVLCPLVFLPFLLLVPELSMDLEGCMVHCQALRLSPVIC